MKCFNKMPLDPKFGLAQAINDNITEYLKSKMDLETVQISVSLESEVIPEDPLKTNHYYAMISILDPKAGSDETEDIINSV